MIKFARQLNKTLHCNCASLDMLHILRTISHDDAAAFVALYTVIETFYMPSLPL